MILTKFEEYIPEPKASIQISTATTVDVTDYATAQIVDSNLTAANIKGGVTILGIAGTAPSGIPTEINTESGMATKLTSNNLTKCYRFMGTDTASYTSGDLYIVTRSTSTNMLCFTANTAGSTIAMRIRGTSTLNPNFQYSLGDLSSWTTFTPGTTTVTLTNAGDKVYFKGNNPNGISESDDIFYYFVMTGSIAASGNIMSLIDNGYCETLTIPNWFCFQALFLQCAALTTAPELPATTLAIACYSNMFQGCTGLTTLPILPATTLVENCYVYMFALCTGLTSTGSMLGTNTPDYCYYGMFYGCTALVTVPILKSKIITTEPYGYMFYGCTALYISDTSISETAEQAWSIPSSGAFITGGTNSNTFTSCLGTRASDNMVCPTGNAIVYYTQNSPV